MSPSDTPFLVRTCIDDFFLAAPIADILSSFAWRGAVLVHEDSCFGTGIIPALADAFLDAGAGIAGCAAVPVDASDDRLDAVLYLVMSKTTRVFVVHMFPSLARRMFRRAKKAGVMSEGYVWIATAGLGDEDRLSTEDIEAMQGVVIVRLHVQPTIQANNFAARFMARLNQENAGSLEIQDPAVPFLWAYDMAWAIATAAEVVETSSRAGPRTDRLGVSAAGETLLKAVLHTRFDGLAGKFMLVDRQLQMPAYEIVNIVADGARTSRVPKGWAVSPSGRELIIAVPVKHGFNQFVDVSEDSTNGRSRITGYCIDVFDAAMKALTSPKADAVVGDVTITSSRMVEVDYTMPFTE
ncbi:Glutamate receptor 2.7 [Dichanthelium oligosanthes]|uniref:Glutamate receptor 2.7 n=1 Tax=Dichanthelium oligosanthes TaxID=888268 RepID=A0A1E5USM5_9POAL|nr:Glutamate receptor 2.7 [Dichanthelium oligosanthes]